jgi:allantoate deiminase
VHAGTLTSEALQVTDDNGKSIADVLGTAASNLHLLGPPATPIRAYVEVHIEQGPVLQSIDAPVGIVSGIAGQTRLAAEFQGEQGHAGVASVPSALRRPEHVSAWTWMQG